MRKKQICRVCGCSHTKPCLDERASALDIEPIGCHWVEKGLCNVCDEKLKALKLTPSNRESLGQLVAWRATSRDRGVFVDGGLRHSTALRSRGLVQNEYVSTRRRTIYWVTPLGREAIRRTATTKKGKK